MVTGRLGRSGKGNFGCIVTFALFGAVVYFGLPLGQIYVRQYQFAEEMRSQARLAPSLTDAVIRRRLMDKADELSLPPEAVKNLKIRRQLIDRERHIIIDSEYQETMTLPGITHTFTFRPHADLPL